MLGVLLNNSNQLPYELTGQHFTLVENQRLYAVMQQLGTDCTPHAVLRNLPPQDTAAWDMNRLNALRAAAPGSGEYARLRQELQDCLNRRNVVALADKLRADAVSGDLSGVLVEAQNQMRCLEGATAGDDIPWVGITSQAIIERLINEPGVSKITRTGIGKLDGAIKGFGPGNVVVVAAKTNVGKTAFALQVALNVVKENPERVVAIFSYEMTTHEINARLIGNLSGVDHAWVADNQVPSYLRPRVIEAQESLRQYHISVWYQRPMTLANIRERCAALKRKTGRLDLVVVDYVQLVDGKRTGNANYDVAAITGGIKCMAMELDTAVIELSQVNRLADPKRPNLSDLRDSGAVEQDADMVIFVTGTAGGNTRNLFVLKNRHGKPALDPIEIGFSGASQRVG